MSVCTGLYPQLFASNFLAPLLEGMAPRMAVGTAACAALCGLVELGQPSQKRRSSSLRHSHRRENVRHLVRERPPHQWAGS